MFKSSIILQIWCLILITQNYMNHLTLSYLQLHNTTIGLTKADLEFWVFATVQPSVVLNPFFTEEATRMALQDTALSGKVVIHVFQCGTHPLYVGQNCWSPNSAQLRMEIVLGLHPFIFLTIFLPFLSKVTTVSTFWNQKSLV